MEISGTITISSPLYNSETNSFVIDHGLSNVYAIPFSLTLMNEDGNFEEVVASKVEFTDNGIIVSLGSLELDENDVLCYMFNLTEKISEDSDSESNSESGYSETL